MVNGPCHNRRVFNDTVRVALYGRVLRPMDRETFFDQCCSIKFCSNRASTYNLFLHRRAMPALAFPGDGVCPSLFQSYEVRDESYTFWENFASTLPNIRTLEGFQIADRLLDIVRKIPPFSSRGSIPFSIIDEPFPQVRVILEWTTSTEPTCSCPLKQFHFCQTLARAQKLKYELCQDSSFSFVDRDSLQTDCMVYFVMAWSYILSSRWVEILQSTGENATLYQEQDCTGSQSFWAIVTGHRWEAQVERGNKTFHAPWSMEAINAEAR